uniref:MARVEL domain-containing protein n=1 Tax=Ditylenchus dipsaci TaxID=166011 RepID=A0A915DRC5_9BILA
MSEQVTWCTSKIAVLKLLQILCSTITFVFLIEGRGQWGAYTLIFVSSLVIGILTLLTLFAYFWRVHANNKFPWISFELGFNLVACMFSGEFHHHRYVPPLNIGMRAETQDSHSYGGSGVE